MRRLLFGASLGAVLLAACGRGNCEGDPRAEFAASAQVFPRTFFEMEALSPEMNPRTERVVWEYVATPRDSFFSATRGGSHRVANDYVLVTESHRGRAFEVTRTDRIVREFYNPHRCEEPGGSGTQRQAIYRMTRVEASIVDRILASRRAHP